MSSWFWLKNEFFLMIFVPLLISIPIFFGFGLYRSMIRYIGFKDLSVIIQAISIYTLLLIIILFQVGIEWLSPLVVLINWAFSVVLIAGYRIIGSWLLSEIEINQYILDRQKVVIYGAGSAGRQLSIALSQSSEYKPVAFIDDKAEIHYRFINGIKVYPPADLNKLLREKKVKEVLLAIPSISRRRRKDIINYLETFPVMVRALPGVTEMAQGKATVDDLLEINLRDLLGREPVKPNKNLLNKNIAKKVVMITGAGGSIGSELCRQIIFLKPIKIVLYDISESSLYQIEQELLNIKVLNLEIFPVIGSVLDKDRMINICKYYGVQTIYHTAAYKHVPLVEYNQSQGVLNNTIGTLVAAEAAISSNVEVFVLISTDKAVRPTNVMGATKRIAELALQALSSLPHNTCLTMARFGNVLDSSGSVIPLFKKQIKDGGPVTVTHADVVRYFMTIPEAVELVIQAGALAKGGEVFVLDMGEPIKIFNLAKKMIQLSGLSLRDEDNPNGDIEIKYSGLRPGEKLFEELLVGGKFTITENELIMRAEEEMISWNKLEPMLFELREAANNSETEKIYKLFHQIVEGYTRH